MNKEQCYDFFAHQLSVVKASQKILLVNAVETVVCASKGVPRLIITIASRAISHAAVKKKCSVVDQETVRVLDELGLK